MLNQRDCSYYDEDARIVHHFYTTSVEHATCCPTLNLANASYGNIWSRHRLDLAMDRLPLSRGNLHPPAVHPPKSFARARTRGATPTTFIPLSWCTPSTPSGHHSDPSPAWCRRLPPRIGRLAWGALVSAIRGGSGIVGPANGRPPLAGERRGGSPRANPVNRHKALVGMTDLATVPRLSSQVSFPLASIVSPRAL